MSRIVLATIGSLGDLHPLIGIGLELRRRGHVVRFCTSEAYRRKLEALGFGFDALRPNATPENPEAERLVREIMDPMKGTERLLRGLIMPELRATYADLHQAICSPPGTDLLICGELVYPAPILAEKYGLPWVTCITAPMSLFSAHDPPILPPVPGLSKTLRKLGPATNRAAIRLVKWFTRNWSEPIRSLRAELGLPRGRDPIYEGKFSPHLVLAIFSSALAAAQPDWPPNSVVTGFPFYDGSPEEAPLPIGLRDFIKAGATPLVFTLGSSAVLDPGEFYQESAKAAALLKSRAVLLIGRNAPPAHLPPGIVAFGYARFSELFSYASAIVHQGGIGTTGQAMRAGRPMLVMPYNFDQPDNADRIVRLGLGEMIERKKYRAERVASKLDKILHTPSYRENAQKIAVEVGKENGAVCACDALEGLLR